MPFGRGAIIDRSVRRKAYSHSTLNAENPSGGAMPRTSSTFRQTTSGFLGFAPMGSHAWSATQFLPAQTERRIRGSSCPRRSAEQAGRRFPPFKQCGAA